MSSADCWKQWAIRSRPIAPVADFLSEAQFDRLACLVVDQNMPQMTGLQMIERLSERGVNIPALLITGIHDVEVERKAAELGVMTVLEKPMSHHELLRFISVSVD